MSHDNDFDDTEDRSLFKICCVPLGIALLAIMVVVGALAITYVCALLSTGDLHGARWAVAIVFLFGVHLLAAFNVDRFHRGLRASYRTTYPVPPLREILSGLNSRRAWSTRLVLALFGVFAAAHLLDTGLPAAVTVGIPLVEVLSLDILALGIWPARNVIEGMGPLLRGGNAP